MNVTEAIRARRSIRQYLPGQMIPQEHIDQLLEAAMCAPSACNSRPWEFVVVENQEMKEQLHQAHPHARFLPDASLAIIVCGIPDALPDAPGEGFWPQDCAAATQNILLQAVDLGYGTCWCGVYPNQELSDAFAKMLHVTSVPFCIIAVGIGINTPQQRGFYDAARVRILR